MSMADISRLGLGTMSMSITRNPEASIDTIHEALEEGITLFNTGEFYGAGESELVVGKALRGVAPYDYFLPSNSVFCLLRKVAYTVWT